MKKRTIQPLLSILLALSLVLSILAAPISAIGNRDMAPQAEVQDNLLTAFEMSYNNKDGDWTTIKDKDNIEVDLSDVNSVLLNYELTRPKGFELQDGDTYVIDLPPFFDGEATDKPVLVGETQIGTYSIADGKITIAFNDHVEDFDDFKMNVNISGKFNTEAFETVEEIKVVVPFRDASSFEATLRGKTNPYEGEDKKVAGFQYVLDDGEKVEVDRNPQYIDWTVLANDDMATVASAKIVDDLGENLELVPESIKAYRIIRNYLNKEIDREEVSITPEMLTASTSGFALNLGSIDDAYEISYTTRLIRPDGGGTHKINNKATIILDSDETEVSDEIDATWSTDLTLIEKKGQATQDPHVLNWEVEYNYAQANLGTVSLSDNLTHGEVILDSVKVFTVDVDIDGNIVPDSQVAVNVTPTLVDGKLTIPNLDANGQAYYISYSSTVPVGLNDETVINIISDNLEEPNTATDSVDVNTIPTGGKVGEQYVDEAGNPYIEWTITLNSNKVNVGHITIRDVFNPEFLDFDVSDSSLYKLYKDDVEATNFSIDEYIHEVDGKADGREGFKLDINNAGPHTYKFVYRTYYTQAGMVQPELANHAELVFSTGDGSGGPGTGIGDPQPLPDAKIEGPNAGIHKDGRYIVNEAGNQEIEWTVVFNKSKVLLYADSTLTEEFLSVNYSYITSSLTLTDAANNVLEEGEDYSLAIDPDSKGFVLTLIKATNAELTLRFRTTVDDTTNLKHENKATLTWQGGEETGEKTVPKRDAGISKSGEVVINDDGSKTVKWTVSFNTQKNVIHNFVLSDTYTPTTVSVSDIKITSGGADVTAEFTISNPGTGGSFTVSKTKLDAKEYTLTYKTTLLPAEEQKAIKNTAAITYIGGSDSIEKPLTSPRLQVEKQANNIANSSNWENPRINWTIFANTDSANKFISLVDAVVADTIPADQRLVSGSVKAHRSDNDSISVAATDIDESSNGFTISLPNGPYQWTITYQSEILYLPSEDATVFDKYNNTVVLTNQSNDEDLKQVDDASAWIRYYANKANDLTGKSGQQNPDTENIDYTVTINPEGLTIHNAEITDSLYTTERNKYHEYVDGSIKLFDANDEEITAGFDLAVAPDKMSFVITFNGTGTIDSKYTIRYSTRLKSNLVGNYTVVNNIVLTGGTDSTELDKSSTTTTAQQWFYGGGGEGRNVELQINKINNQVNNPGPIENAVFKLERINLNGSLTLVDADIVTNESGVFIKGDIRAGRYKLTETATPALYQLMTSPVFFLIGYTDPADYEYEGGEILNPYTVTITNSNWDATEHSHASAEANELTLVNDYKPVSVSLTAGKSLTGQELRNNQFSFGLFNGGGQRIATSRNSVGGAVSFPAQTFSNTGTYTYTVRELAGSQGGMTYDPAVFNVTVVVSEGAEGLVAAVTYTDSESTAVEQPEFNNTYVASGAWTPEVSKALDAGGRVLAADEFNFKLTPVAGAPMPQGESAALTELFASNAADGKVVFASIPYTQADSGQTYYYDVVEVAGTETGMTYDEMKVTIRVDIADNRDGTLSIVPTVQAEQGEEADSEFNNTYLASGDYTVAVGKELSGRELEAGEFEFKLTPVAGATMPGGLSELSTTNTADGTVQFAELQFTQEDIGSTYYYTITEVAGSKGGITYDPLVITLIVIVADGGNGELTIDASYQIPQGEAEADTTFNNEYHADGNWVPTVSKVLDAGGRQLLADEFTFELYKQDENGEDWTLIQTATNAANGGVIFEPVSYSGADTGKEYTYKIVERAGTEKCMTYSTLEVEIVVTIEDRALLGELEITTEYSEQEVVFNNKYAASGEWMPEVSKVLDAGGRELEAGEFNFRLTPVDDATMPEGETGSLTELVASNAADGRVEFATIPYTEADIGQTYYYEVVEVEGDEAGMTYDPMTVRFKVVITDAGNGDLNVVTTVETEQGAATDTEFNNAYAASGEWTPEVSKALDAGGRELKAGEFNFSLTPVDDATMPSGLSELEAGNDLDGKVEFATIPYTQADIGQTYYYEVVEVADDEAGMTYDSMTVRFKVEITDAGGGVLNVETTVETEQGAAADTEFNNTYVASGEWTPEVSKVLDAGGRELEAGEFNFKLTPVDDATMPEGETGALTELVASNAADGTVEFASIPYTEADIGQTYYYEVVEVAGDEAGMTYDPMTVTFKVVVSDVGNGVLNVVTTVETDGDAEVDTEFNNTYEASGEWTPEVSKHLDAGGRELANSEFNFKLTPVDDATMPSGLTELEAANDLDGKVEFTTIPYTQADIGKTYYYEVVEVADDEAGMTYDPMTVTFKVEITDAGGGVLNVVTTVETDGDAEADTEFNNTYVASGSYVVEVEKELSGRELFAEEFNFKLTPVEGATMPEDSDSGESLSELSATNTADGKVEFAELTYTQEDIGSTYYYTITEVAGTEGSITYDPLVITLIVVITDNGDGDLAIETSYLIPEDAEEADTTFNNQYAADGTWVPTVSKVLTAGGRQLLADEFSFDLYLLAEDGETWLLQQTALNAADGGVTFEAINYTEVDTGQVYTYKIVERNGGEIGMTYDKLEVEIVVTVEDSELVGELEITTEYSEERVFNNSYEAAGTFVPEVKKDLLGRDLAAAEFEFTLIPVDGAPMPLAGDEEAVSSSTATNAADGKVIFDAISFSETDIGRTYNYIITEVKGELGGVEYSTQEIVLTVSIADAGNGELAISGSYTDAATFTNKYTVAPIEVVLEAEKELKGMDLVDEQFEFELLDEDGQVLETVTNAADGSIVFSAIEYSAAGEYNYSMREVKGKAAGFIYDETEYRVTVVVKDNGDGTFSTHIKLTDGAVLFSNAYSAALAATGENISTVQSLGTLLLGLGVLTLIQRRRRHSREA